MAGEKSRESGPNTATILKPLMPNPLPTQSLVNKVRHLVVRVVRNQYTASLYFKFFHNQPSLTCPLFFCLCAWDLGAIIIITKFEVSIGFFVYCPYTLLMRCGRVSGNKRIWLCWISVRRVYTTLPYLTLWHAETVGVSHLCCLEQHTEPLGSITEITFRNLPASIWVCLRVHSPGAIYLIWPASFFHLVRFLI